MQKLIMPFQKCMMLCGYKNPQYMKHWGYPHFGVDISTIQGKASDDHRVLASGYGTVVDCGFDNSGGNVVVVIYPDVYNHSTGKAQSLVARYMHLASIAVKPNDKVLAGSLLGVEGNTKTGDHHLHLEFDTDTKYPYHSPQVSNRDDKLSKAQGNILYKGPLDSSVNPSHVLHMGEGQEIVKPTYNPAWLNPEDFAIPKLAAVNWKAEYDKLKQEYEKLQSEHSEFVSSLQEIIKKYER